MTEQHHDQDHDALPLTDAMRVLVADVIGEAEAIGWPRETAAKALRQAASEATG